MPHPTLSEPTWKIIILWLLAGSCLALFLLLTLFSTEQPGSLQSLSQADSLIHQELSLFNVPDEHIQTFYYSINDYLTRKRFVVDLPVQVSKTHFHAELNRQLRPFRVETIGYVNVPEHEMTLHLVFRDKIIRTLDLRTDSEYYRIPHPAGLFIFFDRAPALSQLERIRQLGISAGVVLRSASPRMLTRWAETVSDHISPIWILHDDLKSLNDKPLPDDSALLQMLEEVSRYHNDARLLVFDEKSVSDNVQRKGTSSADITLTIAHDMKIVDTENRDEFDQHMLNFSQHARQATHPRLLIYGTDQTLDWLEDWIPRIQRGGVVFVLP